jgi:hypothetical protein
VQINIWPDYDNLPKPTRDAIGSFFDMSYEQQLAFTWVIDEHRRRVQEIGRLWAERIANDYTTVMKAVDDDAV